VSCTACRQVSVVEWSRPHRLGSCPACNAVGTVRVGPFLGDGCAAEHSPAANPRCDKGPWAASFDTVAVLFGFRDAVDFLVWAEPHVVRGSE
jgi:hypothetical protein